MSKVHKTVRIDLENEKFVQDKASSETRSFSAALDLILTGCRTDTQISATPDMGNPIAALAEIGKVIGPEGIEKLTETAIAATPTKEPEYEITATPQMSFKEELETLQKSRMMGQIDALQGHPVDVEKGLARVDLMVEEAINNSLAMKTNNALLEKNL